MQYLNATRNVFNIAHFQGTTSRVFNNYLQEVTSLLSNEDFPADLTILSIWTCDSKCVLKNQLEPLGIEVINCYIPTEEPWTNPYKIKCILSGLKQVQTKYVLVLDGYDVVFQTFENIIPRFVSMNAGVVFNTSKNNYPGDFQGDAPYKQQISKFKYLNAGCCIGYTDKTIEFYELVNAQYELEPTNKWRSEQLIVRKAFIPFKDYGSDYNLVKLDTNCQIFQTFGQAILKEKNNNYIIL